MNYYSIHSNEKMMNLGKCEIISYLISSRNEKDYLLRILIKISLCELINFL